MRIPVTAMTGNLLWTRSGTVWASWRLTPLSYGYRPTRDKHRVRDAHTSLFRSLRGEGLLQGLSVTQDPVDVVERMIRGVDLEQNPGWAEECEATLDSLADIPLGERVFWLSVPLAAQGLRGQLEAPVRAAATAMKDALALPRAGVDAGELARRREQARQVELRLPPVFHPRPATVAEHLWIYQRAQTRGVTDFDAPSVSDDDAAGVGARDAEDGGGERDLMTALFTEHGARGIAEPLLDEGGQSDLSKASLRRLNPFTRRWLKVVPDGQGEPSYQAMLALGGVPSDGMAFPGSEFIGRLDAVAPEVDWAVRFAARSRTEAQAKNRRAARDLSDQFEQREGEVGVVGAHDLAQIAADLQAYSATLAANQLEVELQTTTVLSLGAASPADADDRATQLAKTFGDDGYTWTRPVGGQEALWWSMLPGTPTNRTARDFAQISTASDFAVSAPLTSTRLGDDRGSLFAINVSNGALTAVLHDIAGATTVKDASGSVAFTGELGSGKSHGMKSLSGAVAEQGGQVIAVDRSSTGEWVTFARQFPDHRIVDVLDPVLSLDPLRVFGPQSGGRVAQSFLATLLNVPPTGRDGVLLSSVLDPSYAVEHDISSLGVLVEHLARDCEKPGARDLAQLMSVFASKDLGRVIFDRSLPVLPLTSAFTVIRTQGLELPTREQLTHEHLFRQLTVETLLGRAIYTLIAALAQEVCFADPGRLGVFAVDETHHVTASSEGEAHLIKFVREGRKARAAAILGSQDPFADFGNETLRGLIPTRILMRHTDRTLARRGLAWLGLDENDDDLLQMITEETSPVGPRGVPAGRRGEGLFRDASGRIGRIRTVVPARAAMATAISTRPPESETAGLR